MPRPESERTLLLRGLDDITANRAMTAALGSPFDVSGAAHVPSSTFRAAGGGPGGLGDLGSPQQAVTLLRLEGITASAAHRAAALAEVLAPFGTAEIVEDAVSAAIWVSVRDVQPFAANGTLGSWPVWRIVCPPASGGALGEQLARDTGGEVIYDWGGGLIWAATLHCCARRSRYGATSMYFIRRKAALQRWASASATASTRKTSSIAAGWREAP
jgi:glycolate oxidase FAD binding subunit